VFTCGPRLVPLVGKRSVLLGRLISMRLSGKRILMGECVVWVVGDESSRPHTQQLKRLQSRGSAGSGWPGRSAATPRDLGRRQHRGVAALLHGHPHGPLACRAGWKSEVSLKLLRTGTRLRGLGDQPRPVPVASLRSFPATHLFRAVIAWIAYKIPEDLREIPGSYVWDAPSTDVM